MCAFVSSMPLRVSSSVPCVQCSTRRRSNVPMMGRGRRKSFRNKASKNENETKASAQTPVPPPEVDRQKQIEETARQYGVDTSGNVRSPEPTVETTFYKTALKVVGKDALNIIEGSLWAVGGGALVFILAVGTAVAFLAYYKATGAPVPERLETFCASGEPTFTPALGLFLSCTTTLGLYKFAEFDYNESMENEK